MEIAENSFTIDEVRAFWDSIVHLYEPANEALGYVHRQRFEKAMEFADLMPGHTVLNIWSRTGKLIPYLRSVPDLTIVNREAAPKMMAIARREYPDEDFALTDLEDLSELADNTFDRVISLETLEHVPKPFVFITELFRILKPGGRLVLSAPPNGAEIGLRIYETFFKNHGEGPHRFPPPSEVKEIFAKAGFNLVAHKPFIIFPLPNDRLTRLSEKVLTKILGRTPLADLGYRHFYIAEKPAG